MKGLTLVTGSSGMVGSRYVELHPNKNSLHLPEEFELDITNPQIVKDVMTQYPFKTIINFAAFTDVDEAEKQRGDKNGTCWLVNVEGVKNLLRWIDPNKAHFVQISTDMVFPGSSEDPGPYKEDHAVGVKPDNLTWYGHTKAMGEKIVRDKLNDKATILRLIYPVRSEFDQKLDYLRKFLKMYDNGNISPAFSDQQISISFIDEVVQAVNLITTSRIFGDYHASTPNTTTPFQLVSYLIKKSRGVEDVLETTSIESFYKKTGKTTRYPKYGGLQVAKTQEVLGMQFSDWQSVINKLVDQGISE